MAIRDRNNIRRRAAFRDPYPIYLLVCEGRVTERQYFADLRNIARVPLTLEFIAGGVPRTLVQTAVSKKKLSHDYDQIWVVFDVDEHPGVPEAKTQAKDNNLKVAISNPCFELWALLHFQNQTGFITRHDAQRIIKTYIPEYEKRLPCELLMERIDDALRRADELRTQHSRNHCTGDNPSTDVDYLVRNILCLRSSDEKPARKRAGGIR